MTIFFQLLLACTFLLAPPAVAAEKPSARWMAHCAANLKSEGLKPAVVQKYCACMAGLGDEDEMLAWSQPILSAAIRLHTDNATRRRAAAAQSRSDADRIRCGRESFDAPPDDLWSSMRFLRGDFRDADFFRARIFSRRLGHW